MIFDLKGSLYKRAVRFSRKDKQWWLKKKGHKKCMKEQNYLKIMKDKDKDILKITNKQKIELEQIIKADSMFLKR